MKELLKIEFGCGGRQLSGWLCTEIDTVDIRKPFLWPDNSCSELHASHIFEHVSSPHAIGFLKECHRILAPDGILRLIVPVVGQQMIREEIVKLVDATHGHECGYNEDLLRTFLFAAGFYPHRIQRTDRKPMDNHHLAIGEERDNAESCRIQAQKI